MAELQHRLLRLSGLKTAQLPSASATLEELTPFITTLLKEALPFIDSAAPTSTRPSLWKTKGTKKFPESAAKVELSERVVTLPAATDPPPPPPSSDTNETNAAAKPATSASTITETWACRRSVHIDSATKGTASWAEFARCLRDEHAATEDAFTPTVLAHNVVQTWTGAGAVSPIAVVVASGGNASAGDGESEGDGDGDVDGDGGGGGGGRKVGTRKQQLWGGFSLSVVEMKHRIPPPLKPRVFPVLQLIASVVTAGDGVVSVAERARNEFVVVSVPVADLGRSSGSGSESDSKSKSKSKGKLAESGSGPGSLPSAQLLSKAGGVVVGAYAAVERVRKEEGAKGDVEWIMATASDAKGSLPMWVQTRAVPGQIAKDVALFLGWIEAERKTGNGYGEAKSDREKEEEGEGEGGARAPVADDSQQPGNGHVSTAV